MNIKVEIQTFSELKNIKEKEINQVKSFFENEFKDLVCDNCEKATKGTVLVGFNKENKGAILDYVDFCCFDFSEKTSKTLK